MLVAVSVVGGTMYTQIGGQECQINTQGLSEPFPTVDQVYQYENQTLLMNLRNPREEKVKINEMIISEDGKEVGIVDINQEINGEAAENIYTNRFSTSENCKTRNIQINYESGKLANLTTNGKLKGKLSLVPIKAIINIKPVFAQTGEEITFNASKSEAENNIKHYNWTFGDGETAQGKNVTHNYSEEAVYRAKLEIEDDEGNVDTETTQVFVGGLLTKSGGKFSKLGVGKSIITKCMGADCKTKAASTSSSEETISTEGAELLGTLFTKRLLQLNNPLCITDYKSAGTDEGCKFYKKGEDNKVSAKNTNITGSLKAPTIKPSKGNNICLGTCQ
jgi:PKD repeat protein